MVIKKNSTEFDNYPKKISKKELSKKIKLTRARRGLCKILLLVVIISRGAVKIWK